MSGLRKTEKRSKDGSNQKFASGLNPARLFQGIAEWLHQRRQFYLGQHITRWYFRCSTPCNEQLVDARKALYHNLGGAEYELYYPVI